MRRNGYLWTSGVNLDTAVRFADPNFLLECKISAIWRRFPLIFAFCMPNVRHISTSWFVWPTDLESIPHALTPTSIISTKFEAPMPIRSWVTGMSYNVSHWLPLKMRPRPLRMRHITWFAYWLLNFYWATTIKGRLLSSVTNAKALDCINFLCVTLWPLTLNSSRTWRVTWPT